MNPRSVNSTHPRLPTELSLRGGEQAVINGALLTATADCSFLVSAGASVISGRAPTPREGGSLPAHELYYAALEALGTGDEASAANPRLLALLAETVARHRTREAQEQCSAFAVGLVSGDSDAMLAAARKLAENELRGADRARIPADRAA